MFPPAAQRILASFGVIASLVAGSLLLPADVAHADAGSEVVLVAPEDGAVVAGPDALLEWTTPGAARRFEVRWTAPSGKVETATTSGTSLALDELAPASYRWQVRSLPEGAWSAPSTFTVDIQLETLPGGTEPEPAPDPVPEATSPLDRVNGVVWVVSASAFALLLLAVVFRAWHRARVEA